MWYTVMDGSWGRKQWLRRDPEEWVSFPEENVMAADDKPRASRVDAARPRSKNAPAERPFDMWLHKQLHAMYDEIAAEPLPNDLLKMIDHDAATDEKSQDELGRQVDRGSSPDGKKP